MRVCLVSRSRADALASLARSVCSPGAYQSPPPPSSLPSSSQHVLLARGPARRNEHTMSSDEPFHSLFTATGSIDGIWPFLQSVSLVRPFPLSFLSPLFFIFLSLSLSLFRAPSPSRRHSSAARRRRFPFRGDSPPSVVQLVFLVSSALHVHSPERTFRFTSADRVSDPNLVPSFDRGGEPELSRVSESQRRSVCQMSRG